MERIDVQDPSGTGEARRVCAALCRDLGLDEITMGKAAIVVTELASNLVKHAKSGSILLQALHAGEKSGIEILSIDSGPGMTDIARCLSDGYSTAGTLGRGLGSIKRFADEFDIYSGASSGTFVLCRLWADGERSARKPETFSHCAISQALHEDEPCGDACAVLENGGKLKAIVADGLGHGADAAAAANTATAIFRKHAAEGPAEIAEAVHGGLRATRGAAIGVAEIDRDTGTARYCGVGNVSARIIDGPASRQLMSHNGTAGARILKIEEHRYPWPEKGILVMHSDGITSHWNLDGFPGIAQRHPALISAALYRDYRRTNDDVSALAIKQRILE